MGPRRSNSGIREWCGQNNAEGSVAPPGTRCRESQGSVARGLVRHGSCREHAFSPSCKQ
jgi:hypothetical protein